MAIGASRRTRGQLAAILRRTRRRFSRQQGHPTDPDGYLGEIGRRIFASMGLAVVLYGLIGGLIVLRSASEEEPQGLRLTLQPLDAGIVAGAYGILAAFVIALQFASRSVTLAQKRAQPGATAFLNMLAQAALLGTLLLTGAAVFGQEGLPKTFDLYRMAGPILLCILIAPSAAEAAMLTDQGSSIFLKFDNHRRLIERTRELRSNIPGPRLGKTGWILQSVGVLLIIPLTVGASLLFRPSSNPSIIGFRIAFAAVSTLIAFALLRGMVKALISKNYASFAGLASMSTLISLLYLLEIATLSMQETGSQRLFVQSLSRDVVAFGVILIGPFCALLPLCMYMTRIGCRGVILDTVSRSFDRTLAKLLAQNIRAVKPRVNRLAITAAAVLPLVPLSVLVAHMARIQIARTGERGHRLVRAVHIAAAVVGTLALLALLLLTTTPIIADWCSGTDDQICWLIEP